MPTTTREIRATIHDVATTSSAEHISQGWVVDGGTYMLGCFHDDLEALEDALGRPAEDHEKIAFEDAMRWVLGGRGVLS